MAAFLLAQAEGGTPAIDVVTTILTWGPAGVVLVAIILGKLRLEREVLERDALIEEQKTLIDSYRTKTESEMIPLLAEATRVIPGFVRLWEARDGHGT